MNIAKFIDHTNINPHATSEKIKATCQEAKEYGFRGVCVRPEWVKSVAEELKGTGVKTVVLIDPPMGLHSAEERLAMCEKAREDGADEIDVVINVVALKQEQDEQILNDLKAIIKILPTKVIIGSGYLTDEEIRRAAALAKEAGAFCVKTATEKDPLGPDELAEKAKHLKIMQTAAPGLLIKASGNIKTWQAVQQMLAAGADIIGTSAGPQILKEAGIEQNI